MQVGTKRLPTILREIADVTQRTEMLPLQKWVHICEDGAAQARPLCVVLYCRSGRHRSVAMATGLQRVFAQRGYNVSVRHFESPHWAFKCGYSSHTCASCSAEQREEPLQRFSQAWERAMADADMAK
jgi:predicted alpha/beta-fold hydrolase